ncbi:MAG: hypothetical protein WC907_06800 [Acholeplasmataceae bacterium]
MSREQVLVVSCIMPGIGGQDSGNQGFLTARAMRRHLGWDAKCLVFQRNYLGYDYDWVYLENVTRDIVMDYARDCSFFVFMDCVATDPAVRFNDFLTRDNHCVLGVGSGLRRSVDYTLMNQIKRNVRVIVPPQDESLCTHLCGVPFDFVIIDIDKIDAIKEDKNNEFTVCHAHTSPSTKGGDVIQSVLADHPEIKSDEIHSLPWPEAIKRKSRAHVIIDSLTMPTYGLNTLESGVLRQHCITNIGPWCYMIHPDFPFMSVNPLVTGKSVRDGVESSLLDLYNNLDSYDHVLDEADRWVRSHHHSSVVAEKWKWYVKWSLNR